MWRDAMLDMAEMLQQEMPADPTQIPREKKEAYEYFAQWYIKHLQMYHKLYWCYDQMVHPQKRLEVKKALESCMTHILELRSVLQLLTVLFLRNRYSKRSVKLIGLSWTLFSRIYS